MRHEAPDKWKAKWRCRMPDEALIGWMHNYSRTNYWRVSHIMEPEDLLQEGWLKYCFLRKRYGMCVSPAHMMALFKRTYERHINDLSVRAYKVKTNEIAEAAQSEQAGDEATPMELLQEAEANNDLQGLLMVIADAPSEPVRQFLATFMSEKAALLSRPIYSRFAKRGETPNDFICRMLGFDPGVVGNVMEQAREYLLGHPSTA